MDSGLFLFFCFVFYYRRLLMYDRSDVFDAQTPSPQYIYTRLRIISQSYPLSLTIIDIVLHPVFFKTTVYFSQPQIDTCLALTFYIRILFFPPLQILVVMVVPSSSLIQVVVVVDHSLLES